MERKSIRPGEHTNLCGKDISHTIVKSKAGVENRLCWMGKIIFGKFGAKFSALPKSAG